VGKLGACASPISAIGDAAWLSSQAETCEIKGCGGSEDVIPTADKTIATSEVGTKLLGSSAGFSEISGNSAKPRCPNFCVCVSKVLESNHPKLFGPHESDFGRENCRAIKWPVRFYGSDQAASAHEASFHRLEPMATNGHNLCLLSFPFPKSVLIRLDLWNVFGTSGHVVFSEGLSWFCGSNPPV